MLFKKGANLKLIDCSAFYKTALTEVTIPASVERIGNNAFGICRALTTVTFENGRNIKYIDIGAFNETPFIYKRLFGIDKD